MEGSITSIIANNWNRSRSRRRLGDRMRSGLHTDKAVHG